MTYRERREAKADRLDGWAEKREADAGAVIERNRTYTGDIAFNTQPGHIPLRARVIKQNDNAFASLNKARSMSARADGIRSQLAEAIYSDDPDAIDRLEQRIAELEQRRERIKADNARFRKAHAKELRTMTPYQRDQAMPHAGYELRNLAGNITRQRQRLAEARRDETVRAAPVQSETARDDGGVHRITAAREEIEYPDKPSAEIRAAIKAQGYRWDRVALVWWRHVPPVGHAPDIDLANGF
jgi:Domain of unknown function (DUF3560)